MTALSTKMSYPGTSSSYQTYYQPVHHNGFSNSPHLSSYPHHPRFAQQQQHSLLQKQPAAFPHSNSDMQTQGNQWPYGMSIPQRIVSNGNHFEHKISAIEQSQHGGNLKGTSQPAIKSEPIMHTDVTPSQHDPPDLTQHRIVNNSASKAVNSNNQARPHGAFAQPHGVVSSQFPRTWIPARQPFLGNVPRAPANSVLAQVPKAVPARQPFIANVSRAPTNTVLTQPLQNNILNKSQVLHQGRSWVVSASDFKKYRDLFHKADTDKDGFVTGMEVRDMFIGTGLSQKYLIHIWDLVDTNQKGRLNCEQFALAMWMAMRTAVHKIEPPKELSSEMIPPSMRVKVPTVPNTLQYKKKENLPKPTNDIYVNIAKKINEMAPAITKPNKVTPKGAAKKAKRPTPPKNDLYGCPKCSLMYDDSQHSPRQLPCRHTFCIDCIDEALSEDVLNCFVCGTSHTVLAAADFPVNVFITELLRRFLEEQSEEERKKYVHDTDACFYCESDEPPLKRIKVGANKITCEIESSQEKVSSIGCEMGKLDGKLGDTHVNDEIRDTCNESENNINSIPVLEKDSQGKENDIVSIGLPTSSINAAVSDEQNLNHNLGNTDKGIKIRDTCSESDNNLYSLWVLENYSQGKENSIVSTELQASSINVSVSNEQNVTNNTGNVINDNDRTNSNENSMNNKLTRVENGASNYGESSDTLNDVGANHIDRLSCKEVFVESRDTLNEVGANHIDRLSCKEVFVENSTEVNINIENTLKTKETYLEPALSILQDNCNSSSIQEKEQETEYQRLPRKNDSKIDENMNSLSVDKFLEEIL